MKAGALPKYFEGGNLFVAILLPFVGAISYEYYPQIASHIGTWGIDTQVLYSYVLNLFAIEFGALLALFALLACRPTQFLERIKNTAAFHALFSNIKITLSFAAACILCTFFLGVLKLEPSSVLNAASAIFVGWLLLTFAASGFYVRSVRLTTLALT